MNASDYQNASESTNLDIIQMKLGERATDKKNMMNKLVNNVPIAVRQFAYDTVGGEGDITEKNLSNLEMDALKAAIKDSYTKKNLSKDGKSYIINYDTWRNSGSGGSDTDSDDMNLFNPASSLQKMLGRAKFTIDKFGNIEVQDEYNFNDAGNKNGKKSTPQYRPLSESTSLSNGVYRIARNFKSKFGSSEGGSKSTIYVGTLKDLGLE